MGLSLVAPYIDPSSGATILLGITSTGASSKSLILLAVDSCVANNGGGEELGRGHVSGITTSRGNDGVTCSEAGVWSKLARFK